jgi:hypothetical protein
MNYIFNAEGKCVASCNYSPNTEDLSSRGEIAIESNEIFEIDKISLVENTIVLTSQSQTFEEAQKATVAKFGAEFARRRDAITWSVQADGSVFGYDRQTEDITNFLAAMQRAYLGADTYYKVYLNSVETKAMKLHTYKMFQDVLEQSAQEQILAYTRYEELKYQIQNVCETIEDIDALTW